MMKNKRPNNHGINPKFLFRPKPRPFVQVPSRILNSPQLSAIEVRIYSFLYGLIEARASRKTISILCACSVRKVSQALKSLEGLKLIKVHYRANRPNRIEFLADQFWQISTHEQAWEEARNAGRLAENAPHGGNRCESDEHEMPPINIEETILTDSDQPTTVDGDRRDKNEPHDGVEKSFSEALADDNFLTAIKNYIREYSDSPDMPRLVRLEEIARSTFTGRRRKNLAGVLGIIRRHHPYTEQGDSNDWD